MSLKSDLPLRHEGRRRPSHAHMGLYAIIETLTPSKAFFAFSEAANRRLYGCNTKKETSMGEGGNKNPAAVRSGNAWRSGKIYAAAFTYQISDRVFRNKKSDPSFTRRKKNAMLTCVCAELARVCQTGAEHVGEDHPGGRKRGCIFNINDISSPMLWQLCSFASAPFDIFRQPSCLLMAYSTQHFARLLGCLTWSSINSLGHTLKLCYFL
jgi:hypothetical protein